MTTKCKINVTGDLKISVLKISLLLRILSLIKHEYFLGDIHGNVFADLRSNKMPYRPFSLAG